MGYAGTLAAGWCDYLVCDTIVAPQDLVASEKWRGMAYSKQDEDQPELLAGEQAVDFEATLDPESAADDWV
jgi:protein O-GlcNAc transferase